MPNEKGIWSQEEADSGHLFSRILAEIFAQIFNKEVIVYDIGCGNASYVEFLEQEGFNAYGIEGRKLLNSKSESVYIQDLTESFQLNKKGNVICLEVAEHIPEQYEEIFIQNVVNHVAKGCFLILSWAVPGQEGLGHVNCKPNEYVIERIKREGFRYLEEESDDAREAVEEHLGYFKNTLMVFLNL